MTAADAAECPCCGCADLVYVVYGLVGAHAFEYTPAWIRVAGCVVQDFNRECTACGHRWWDDAPAPEWSRSGEA